MIIRLRPDGEPPFAVRADVAPEIDGVALAGPVRVEIEVSRDGEVVRLDGTVAGTFRAECDRCLAPVDVAFRESFVTEVDLAAGRVSAVDIGVDEEVASIALLGGPEGAEEIDAADEIRMRVAQALPDRVLCREACLGLCPACGADRNRESCACAAGAIRPPGPFAGLARILEISDGR